MGYFIIAGVMSLIGMFVSNRLKSKFRQYDQVPLSRGLTGREVAENMLRHYGISDVRISEGRGMLTDHYNPAKKEVKLSPAIYNKRTIMAAAVAAHEVGHAVQHATAYPWLKFRSSIVPLVGIASNVQSWLLAFALGLYGGTGNSFLLLITIVAFMITTAFAFITLPVEFDASKRALAWLDETGFARNQEYDGAKDALWWAAMTYVAKALSSLALLIYLVLRYQSSRR